MNVCQDIGRTECVEHHIATEVTRPIRERSRRFPSVEQEKINRQVQDLLMVGRIVPSSSPWASNVVLFKKDRNKLDQGACSEKVLRNQVSWRTLCGGNQCN